MIHNSYLRRAIRIARWTAVLSVLCAVVTIGVTAISARGADRPMEWALNHKALLPDTLGQLAAYPAAYRSWIFTEEPDAIRLTMIRQHIRDLLASTRFNWSDEQRQFLLAGLDQANRARHFSDLTASCKEVQKVFPKGPMRDAVRTVGTETAPTYRFTNLAVWAKLSGQQMMRWITPVTLRAEEEILKPYCNCHDNACDCDEGYACDLDRACRATEDTCHAESFWCTEAHACDGYAKHCGIQ
jgi:hypothetical protein